MKDLIITTILSVIVIFGLISVDANAEYDESLLWNPRGLPVDEERGPWFATIDLDAIDWAWKRQTQNVRKGDTALRFEVREGDCFTANPNAPETGWDDCTRDRERSEIREKWSPPLHRETWYAFSMYIPQDYEFVYPKQMFFQWHGGDWGPNAYFQLNRDKFLVDILTKEHQTTSQYELSTLPKGEWIDFVVSAVWSNKQDGKLVVYVNGKLELEHVGPTMDETTYSKGKAPHVKMGIYRSHLFRWKEDRPMPTHVLYFDEYRRGYRYEDVGIGYNAGD